MRVSEKYIGNVRNAFPIYGKEEKRFIRDLDDTITDYENGRECSMDELIERFGRPHQVAMNYFSEMEEKTYFDLMKRVRLTKRVMMAVVTFIIVALVIFSVFLLMAYIDCINATPVEYTETIIETKTEVFE